jgi:hypothetical protein
MYNWLKTLVNQVRNLRSTKWDDHEMVKVILRSLVFCNPTQVQLIRGDPRYKLMSPEEVIGKFVSFELMIKGSKQIVEQGGCNTLNLGVEFFLLFSHQIRALLSFLFPFRLFFSNFKPVW